MNATTLRIDFARLMREPTFPIFTIGLPAVLYVVFGGSASYGSEPIGTGNISMLILINMALYGAMTATVSVSSLATTEKMQGWGRRLALSGQSGLQYIGSKVLIGLTMAAVTVGLLFLLGFAMGAEAPATGWLLSYVLILAGSAMMALFGLAVGLAIRSDVAVSISSGLLVLFGFAGNLFTPLSDTLYKISQFTPAFGIGVLARYPVSEGVGMTMDGFRDESLLIALINIAVWAAIFAVACVFALRRSHER